MTFTKEQLVKEAANTLMEMGNDSFFGLENATLTIKDLLARFKISEDDLIAELLRWQQEHEDDGNRI